LPTPKEVEPDSDPTTLENIIDEAIVAARNEAQIDRGTMYQRFRPFANTRDRVNAYKEGRDKAYTARRKGGRRKKTQRSGGANPAIAPFVALIKQKLYGIKTSEEQRPQVGFARLVSEGGIPNDTFGDKIATLLFPVLDTFLSWRHQVQLMKIRYSPIMVADADDMYEGIKNFTSIQRLFAKRDPILGRILETGVIRSRRAKVTAAEEMAAQEQRDALAAVPQQPPSGELVLRTPVPAAPASPEAAAGLAVEAESIEARPVQPLPQQRPAVEVEGAPGAGTGLFAAPAAALPDTAAIQEAETRVREEAAAALAAAKAAATEERNAAVQATEKRIREEAAAAQATLEMRAVAAENALELNKGDVAKKAAELLELRASAEKHENDAQIAATAAKEQEARAQRAEGQLNAAKEALQTLSVGHMSTSSRVPSLAESEAKVRRLQENQLLAEAQAKAARTDAPPSTGDSSLSDVVDRIEEPASPVAAPAAVAPPPLPEMVGLRTPFETGNSAAVPHPRGKTPPRARASLLAAHAALGLPNPPATESRLRSTLPKLTPEEKKKYQGLTPSKVGMRIPLREPLKKGGRRKTSKKRKTRKPRKSTFRRHRKH